MASDNILHIDGDAIHIPAGPLSDNTRDRVERAVALNIPDGKHLAVLAMLDKTTGAPLTGAVGVAVRIGDEWKLTAEARKAFGGPASAFLGLVGAF